MAGHSKWANIRHRKERVDAKRGKLFSRLIREVMVAARVGGGDAAANPRLRLALDRAREANVPGDNLERAVKRGAGQLEGADYEEVRYEGYGPGGAAVIVDCLTDNRNRTLAEVRHAFSRNGGNLGADGSVAFMFRRCGRLLFAPGADADAVMEAAIEHGADEVDGDAENGVEVVSPPEVFPALLEGLRAAGLRPEFAAVVMRPENETALTGAEAGKARKFLEALEDLDDTQEVHTNVVFPDDDGESAGEKEAGSS